MIHLKTTWQHLRRSPYQSLSAILIMSLTFFLTTVFLIIALGSASILNYFESRPQVTVFFKEDIKTNEVEALKEKLKATGKVSDVKFVSKEEALAIYKEQNRNDPLLLEMVTANILPASLEVSALDLKNLGEIAQVLKDEPQVEEVIFQEDVVSSLSTWVNALRKIGIGLVGFLATVSFLVILIVIGMKIAIKREEFEILKLVGAKNSYIRAPFIFEGISYGLIGAFIGWGVAYLLLLYATPFLVSFLAGIPILPVSPLVMLYLLGALLGAGLLIGTFSSFLAVKRYLR